MNIYNNPYTYLIGWSQLNKFYYGVRYAKDCHPDDLWVKYYTSSKYVAECREEHGEPDIIQIRKTFDSRKSAHNWETKVLQRMKVLDREDFINKGIAGYYVMDDAMRAKISEAGKGRILSEEHKAKISKAGKGKTLSEEHRAKLSKAHMGKKISAEHIAKSTAAKRGKHLSTDTKNKIADTLKNNDKVNCPHCQKTGSKSPMARWHFDNCKAL